MTAVVGESVETVDHLGIGCSLFDFAQTCRQIGRESLVGIDAENPVTRGEVVGEVLLLGVSFPRVTHKLGTGIGAYLLGTVGRARVNDYYFVDNSLQRLKAAADVALLVMGDDYG